MPRENFRCAITALTTETSEEKRGRGVSISRLKVRFLPRSPNPLFATPHHAVAALFVTFRKQLRGYDRKWHKIFQFGSVVKREYREHWIRRLED